MNFELDGLVPQGVTFLLVIARLSGLFLLAPVFSSKMIPGRIKVMALLVLAASMTPVVYSSTADMPLDGIALATMLLKETLIGFALGFAVSIVFSAVQAGASLIDTSIGFAIASVLDPAGNNQTTVLGSFYSMVATLVFLSVNGHAWLLRGFTRSFEIIPIDQMPNFHRMLENAQDIFVQLFAMAFQIAAPVLVTLLMADVVLGLLARVVPQMNVFFVGVPLKIAVGLGTVILAMPAFAQFLQSRVEDIVAGASILAGAG